MKLDVTGHRPWPGPKWDGFRITLEGSERSSALGLREGEAISYREDGRLVYLFGMGRTVTPPGGRPRREPTELVIGRVEVSVEGSPARLVADFNADRLVLEIGDERRKGQLDRILEALPILQLPPPTGRPKGSRQVEDVDGLRRRIEAAIATLRSDHRRVSVRAVAAEIGYNESTLSKKLGRLKIPLPR